jgi:hypothetical protein
MSDERLDEIIRSAARDYHVPDAPPRDEMWAKIEQARRQAGVVAIRHSSRAAWLWPAVGIAAVLVLGIGIGRMVERDRVSRGGPPVALRPDSTNPASRTSVAVAPNGGGSVAPDTTPNVAPGTRTAGQAPRQAPQGNLASKEGTTGPLDLGAGASHDDASASEGLAFRLAVLQHLAGTEAMLTTFRTEAKSGEVDARLTSWARNLLRTTHMLQASSVASNDPTLKRLLDDLELVLLQIAQYTAKSPHRAEELELIERSIDKRGVMAKLRATNPAAQMPAGT